jgi:hypothetical protein
MTTRGGGLAAARPGNRSKPLLATAAVLLALWFGLAAPSVSPVAGPAIPAAPTAVVQDQGQNQDQGGAIGDGAAVADGAGGRTGRGRR